MKPLLQVQNLSKRYGDDILFEDASATFSEGQKIGVIGRNGAGKTTLCRILIGEEEPDEGEIVRNGDCRVGYLAQGHPFEEGESVLGYLMRVSGREEWECGRMAGRFGLKNDRLEAEVSDLPGGLRTRVKLTAMLLDDPNFLVLDEPTNYLDLSTVLLLQEFLRDFNGGFLLVSHDREFLKSTCDETLEIEHHRMTMFPGNVEEYLAWKEEQRERKRKQNKEIRKRRKELKTFIAKNRVKASGASQAQSKLKQLARLKTIRIDHPIQGVRMTIPSPDVTPGRALVCKDLAIGYPDQTVARGIRVEVERGEHLAVLGDNGQGKTTFLRTLAGDLPPKEGSVEWSRGLDLGTYAQHVYGSLPEDRTIYEYLVGCTPVTVSRQAILDMAGSFLFQGDDVEKPIRVLSGGERARLSLAGLLLQEHAVLLLDEPTNHLDFQTVEVLGNALREYEGTVLFVSHDRTFVNLVASGILEVKDGRVTPFPGSYEEYVYYVQTRESGEVETREPDDRDGEDGKNETRSDAKEAYLERKKLQSRVNRLSSRVEAIETEMERFEAERAKLHDYFLENPTDYDPEKTSRLDNVKKSLEETEATWFELQEQIEDLKARIDALR